MFQWSLNMDVFKKATFHQKVMMIWGLILANLGILK